MSLKDNRELRSEVRNAVYVWGGKMDAAALDYGVDRIFDAFERAVATPSPKTGGAPTPCCEKFPRFGWHSRGCAARATPNAPGHDEAAVPAAEPGKPATCGTCGGDGYSKRPSLGDEPCAACLGTGRATPEKGGTR